MSFSGTKKDRSLQGGSRDTDFTGTRHGGQAVTAPIITQQLAVDCRENVAALTAAGKR